MRGRTRESLVVEGGAGFQAGLTRPEVVKRSPKHSHAVNRFGSRRSAIDSRMRRFRASLTAAFVLAGFDGLQGPQAIAASPPRLAAPIYADYDSELREATARADGIKHVASRP